MRSGLASDVFEAQVRGRRWRWLAWVGRAASFAWKSAVAVACVLHPLSAVVLVGWMSRVMQRTAVQAWWRHVPRPYRKLIRFRDAARHVPGWSEWVAWPNWLLSQQPVTDFRAFRLHRLFRGVWENARRGLEMALTTAAALGVPVTLLALAWSAKSGAWAADPALLRREAGVFALVAGLPFTLVMFHVPMAQARQAVTGDWRCFFDFSLVRRVVRRRWLRCTLLAVGLAATVGVVPAVRELPAVTAAAWLALAFAVVRWAAATVYASAISHMLATGEVLASELAPAERLAFPPELIANADAAARWSRRDAVLAWTLSAPFRAACAVVVTLAWTAALASLAQHAHSARDWAWWPTVWLPLR